MHLCSRLFQKVKHHMLRSMNLKTEGLFEKVTLKMTRAILFNKYRKRV